MDGDESDASGMSNREIRFLLELPEDEYYDVRGQYSSDDETRRTQTRERGLNDSR